MKNREYKCKSCYYLTDNKKDYDKHCNTSKHNKNIKVKTNQENDEGRKEKEKEKEKFNIYNFKNEELKNYNMCEYCNHIFSRLSSLMRQKKICYEIPQTKLV